MLEGIVYNIVPYKEKSELVYLITPQGLVSLLVRGAKDYKSGNMAFCQTLNLVEFSYSDTALKTLISYNILSDYKNIKNSFIKLKYASIILEVARQSNDVRTERIYIFLKNVLNKIENGYDPLSIAFIYLVKMTQVFGIKPDFNYFSYLAKIKEEFIKAYNTKDYDLIIDNISFKILVKYYVNLDIINMHNILKMVEV